ncbi:presenilin [Chlorella sorokiniana]|uniref:Presenilin n=1 Tax=Chlorella sorokiniana TaxID=3076 RepID=A0A2P6TYQ9_CHLSO|nr:presenilin [Chlorella sorokiniana]|eukprot:PRW59201.1 presenilin [Chlorella sorokiniana]
MRRSVLDDLGEEVTGIVSPVSICMALTVALVRILNPEGESNSGAVFLASAYYSEAEGDSTSKKLGGALLNALIFIGVVAVMTFVLVLLFKYGCTKLIYAYMGFAGFSIFFVLAGVIALELLQKWDVHTDFISFTYILFNFAMVGAVTLFFFPAPLIWKQIYLIITGVVTAYVFTWIPEWTTWVLLVAMAIYDVVAVLVPGGPLKMLVELAQEREETIPALVYEARPVRRDNTQGRLPAAAGEGPGAGAAAEAAGGVAVAAAAPAPQTMAAAGQLQQELTVRPGGVAGIGRTSVASTASAGGSSGVDGETASDTPLIRAQEEQRQQQAAVVRPRSAAGQAADAAAEAEAGQRGAAPGGQQAAPAGGGGEEEEEEGIFELPEAIKLGLGDFIFYATLLGRAAMYDFLTVFACYLAIIAGLGCTLLWLALARKALPALPISIALAVTFYFCSRFVIEPVLLPQVLELVYY